MELVGLAARVFVAGIFLLSAVTKLRDRNGARDAAAALGVPGRWSGIAASALPIAELATGGLLVVGRTATVGLLLALLLLGSFTVVLTVNLAGGRRPACRCFGQLSSSPISTVTVARNLALLAVTAVGFVDGDPAGLVPFLERQDASTLAALITALGTLGVVAGGLHLGAPGERRSASAHEVAADIDVAPEVRPDFELPTLAGDQLSLPALLERNQPVLVVFSDPDCGPCNDVVPRLEHWQKHHNPGVSVVYMSSGTEDRVRAKAADHGIDEASVMLLHEDYSATDGLGFRGTPSAALIARDGSLVAPTAAGGDEIAQLLHLAESSGAARTVPAELHPGEFAPAFHLHAVDGTHIGSDSLAGRLSVLLFWEPASAACGRLLPALAERHREMTEAGCNVVMVSSSEGGLAERSGPWHYVVDDDRQVWLSFGVTEAPAARLVDAQGRVASAIAVGDDEINQLIDRMIVLGPIADELRSAQNA